MLLDVEPKWRAREGILGIRVGGRRGGISKYRKYKLKARPSGNAYSQYIFRVSVRTSQYRSAKGLQLTPLDLTAWGVANINLTWKQM